VANSLVNCNGHFYNIHGLVNLKSSISLPELSLFEVKTEGTSFELSFFEGKAADELDLIIETGLNGFHDRERTFEYSELSPIGASIRVELGHPLRIRVSSFLAQSEHVVYTNVVEPLLRFLFVSKGYVLLHSACLSTPQGGLLISAPPDTGKTTTILKLILQSSKYLLLSDDMTILDPKGKAYCFPKPPTISLHTLNAIRYDYKKLCGLPFLVLRSMVHSKKGRNFMRSLGKLKIPIFSINALGQILIPPPKPPIISLIGPDRLGQTCQISALCFIARGKPVFKAISLDSSLEMVEANSDNAFNFPPYSDIMGEIEIDGRNYWNLKSMESRMLRGILKNLRVSFLRTEEYSWQNQIMRTFETEKLTTREIEERYSEIQVIKV
jgi:hypothetical protein